MGRVLRHFAAAFAAALCAAALVTSCSVDDTSRTAAAVLDKTALSVPVPAADSAAAGEQHDKTVLNIFAAASLQETLTGIALAYEQEHPDVSLVCTFDSSGTLKTQIEEGAPCDIFISAASGQIDELESSGYVAGGTRMDLLQNKVVLAVPDDNPAGLSGFDDLVEQLREEDILLAVGNSDVPVGQYTMKIFGYYDLSEDQLAASGKVTYGSNVKEVTTQVSEASVDGGIIYATDAFSAGLTVVGEASPEMCGMVVYPAAMLEQCGHENAAAGFLQYLASPEAMAVFESAGFSPAS